MGRPGVPIIRNSRASAGGFTLVELMMVVVIVAVLLTVGLPAYRDQVLRGNRAAAKAEMMDIANRQHQFLLANRAYADKATLPYSLPTDVAENYTYDIALAAPPAPPFFTITFTAIGGQVADGDLTLDSEGVGGPAAKWER